MEIDSASSWTTNPANGIGLIKRLLSKLSLKVRAEQLKIMVQTFNPDRHTKILDMGFAPEETLPDTNFFEKEYSFPNKITAVSVEDCSKLKKQYPQIHIVKTTPNKKLPYHNVSFTIATSWATLEHVGGYRQQEFFLNDLLRVGKHIFVTTPLRGCIYEPHTGLLFLHWLPLSIFRKICIIRGQDFWAMEKNLNPLNPVDILKMKLRKKIYIKVYKTLTILPSHMLISDVPFI